MLRMKNRIHSRKTRLLKLDLPPELNSETTLLAYGNILKVEDSVRIWCLFTDQETQLYETLLPLSSAANLPLGSHFSNGYVVNKAHTSKNYQMQIDQQTPIYSELPRKLLQVDLSRFQGQYHKQPFIKVRNKQILLSDLMIRTLCPAPEFSKIALTLLSQPFLFRHVYREPDHLYVELDRIFQFRITTTVARQLALLAGSPEYLSWHKKIAIASGEALASKDGFPWHCPLPPFKLNTVYSVIESSQPNPFYQVHSARPYLPTKYKGITIFFQQKSETFQV